jgi:hypothetical protein
MENGETEGAPRGDGPALKKKLKLEYKSCVICGLLWPLHLVPALASGATITDKNDHTAFTANTSSSRPAACVVPRALGTKGYVLVRSYASSWRGMSGKYVFTKK